MRRVFTFFILFTILFFLQSCLSEEKNNIEGVSDSTVVEVKNPSEKNKNGVFFEENDSLRVYKTFVKGNIHGKVFYYDKKQEFIICMGKYSQGELAGEWKYFDKNKKVIYELTDILVNPIQKDDALKYSGILKTFTTNEQGSQIMTNEKSVWFQNELWKSENDLVLHGDEKIFDNLGNLILLKRWEENKLVETIKM